MQSLNSIAGYSRKIEWETVFNGLKRDLKKMWAIYPNPPKDLEARYAKLSEFGAIVDDIEDEPKKSSGGKGGDEDGSEKSKSRRRRRGKGKKSTEEKEDEKAEGGKAEGGKSKKDGVRVPKELWDQRRKAGLCMKCGSDQHRIRDCKSEAVTTDAKDAKGDSRPKPKEPEKKVAALEVAEVVLEPAQQVSAVQTGRIFESDEEEELVWDSE